MNTFIDPRLQDIVKKILNVENPGKIILFGSRARGENGSRSDFDIALFGRVNLGRVMDSLEDAKTLLKIDVVAYDELDNKKLKKNIIEDGKVIYERKV